MFKSVGTFLFAVFVIGNTHVSAAPVSYTLDPTHTYLNFAVSHLGFSTMYGRFNKTSGKFVLDLEEKTASVDVKIETVSIDTGLKKRDDHLRSPDFFNVVEYPLTTFKSSTVKFDGNSPTVIVGHLTLLGVSKPVTLEITAFKCGTNPMNNKKMCGVDAVGEIKRSDFGMKYALPGVGDEVRLIIEAEGYMD